MTHLYRIPLRRSLTAGLARDAVNARYTVFGEVQNPLHTCVYFHGWSNSCLEGKIWDDEARARRIRVLTVDRPSLAVVAPGPELYALVARAIESCPGIADGSPVSLLSFSGGTAPLMEFARDAKTRVSSAHVVSPVPPLRGTFAGLPLLLQTVFTTCRLVPPLARKGLQKIADPVVRGEWTLESTLKQISNPLDQAAIRAHPAKMEAMVRGLAEACYGDGCGSGEGFTNEGRIMAYKWDPDLDAIAERLRGKAEILCGEEDDRIPFELNRQAFACFGEGFRKMSGHGHTSIIFNEMGAILDRALQSRRIK